jgi:hypothetical protein
MLVMSSTLVFYCDAFGGFECGEFLFSSIAKIVCLAPAKRTFFTRLGHPRLQTNKRWEVASKTRSSWPRNDRWRQQDLRSIGFFPTFTRNC